MEIIITPDRLNAHRIAKYEFKNFDGTRVSTKEKTSFVSAPKTQSAAASPVLGGFSAEEKETLVMIDKKLSTESGMMADMLKKIEEFGDHIVKLQLRLEKQEDEFAKRLADERANAFEEGKTAGENEAKNAMLSDVQAQKDQLLESIDKLDKTIEEFGSHAASLEKELSSIAVEIANEVIGVEAGENSAKIAAALASSLLNEIKEAQKITIRVSPDDIDEIKARFADDTRIAFAADKAINKGGVVILSDAGNIDAQLHSRFMAIKKSILEGGAV
ncbi:MAG: hypothetical protein LBN32_04645 [Helicobacteraceae bacterium]|jgi:flagellar assembly protein FliH|nr:hypothetical protein [Helicobacteraceae bacterium]